MPYPYGDGGGPFIRKNWLALLGVFVASFALMAACASGGEPVSTDTDLTRYVDEEHGIVCYQIYRSSAALSCATMQR